jgi:hypothetical protein
MKNKQVVSFEKKKKIFLGERKRERSSTNTQPKISFFRVLFIICLFSFVTFIITVINNNITRSSF